MRDPKEPETSAAAGRRISTSPSLLQRLASAFSARIARDTRAITESEAISDPTWNDEARAALAAAFEDARNEGRPTATCGDVIGALQRRGDLEGLCRALRVDFDVERNAGEPWSGPVDASPELVWAIVRSRARAFARKLGPIDLFVACYQSDLSLRRDLTAALLKPQELARFAAHGVARHHRYTSENAPAGDELAIVLHNDDYTTQPYVVSMLRDLGLDDAEASKVMLEVHHEGEAVLAEMSRSEAIEIANEILDDAERDGMPLKVTLRTAPPAERVSGAE